MKLPDLTLALAAAGCVAAAEEADELLSAAEGDEEVLRLLLARRLAGEPLAWVTGGVSFLGARILVDHGVYVPRPQSEALARRAIELLPPNGLAADLCTGSGALAVALMHSRPGARVVASDCDEAACACARRNGVEVHRGDLAEPLPPQLAGRYDLVLAVVPYVPSDEIAFLPRDSREFEPLAALDGGRGGTEVLGRAVTAAASLLRPGGHLLLELGGEQGDEMAALLERQGFSNFALHRDDEEDIRFLEAIRSPPAGQSQ